MASVISELYTLKKWLSESDSIVCVTGPDFSREAGFPDYRRMEDGFLDTYKYSPQEILKVSFLQRYPFYFYKFFRERMLTPMLEAKPSFAHETLAGLERAGKLRAILTVNIDGIHQEADSRNVLELRGSMMRNWCARCEKYLDFTYIPDSPTPIAYCNVDMCGDFVRPDIVLGEEPYDLELLARALEQVRQCDTLLVDGSAMGEFPVPNLLKAYQGHKLVMFNTPPLVFDKMAGLIVRNAGTFSEIFAQLELEL